MVKKLSMLVEIYHRYSLAQTEWLDQQREQSLELGLWERLLLARFTQMAEILACPLTCFLVRIVYSE